MSMSEQEPQVGRPLDARLARALVRPLCNTWVTPNHLTTLRTLLGLAAALAFARGELAWASVGAWLFVISNFVDHTDGELARMSGQTSRWGHYYDLASDALVHVLLFVGIGYGLRDSALGDWGLWLGLLAGSAVAFIFWLHMHMESQLGKAGAKLPDAGYFEIEDVLYLLPLITIFDIRLQFLIVASIGASVFAVWLTAHYYQLRRSSV